MERDLASRFSGSPTSFPVNADAIRLFALSESRDFGLLVAREVGLDLAEHEERAFEDGEHKVRPLIPVRDRDVYVIQSLYDDGALSVNDKLCRLLFFLGALRDAGAGRLTAVLPYLCYARKDRKTKPRDPVTIRYVASMFEAVEVDRVVTIDVHDLAAYQNAFRCRTEHLEARLLFVARVADLCPDRDVTVVAPDPGGVKRAEAFRASLESVLGRPVAAAFMEKQRSAGRVTGEGFVGDVEGRVAIVVDDLVSSGTTLVRAAGACRERGARAVFAAATHGVFVGDASRTLDDGALDSLLVTDTIPPFRLAPEVRARRLTVVAIAPLFAEAIRRLHGGGSLVELTTG
jgi:ribose-phosphate pyrophosphokinase